LATAYDGGGGDGDGDDDVGSLDEERASSSEEIVATFLFNY